jgi:hypothetical protein
MQTAGKILRVDFSIEESNPPNLVVTAVGQVPTGGYDPKKVTLQRVAYVAPPADGIQDYKLTAVKPTGIVTQVISEVSGKDRWKGYTKEAPWLKGVRVHGVGDGIVVKMLPKSR